MAVELVSSGGGGGALVCEGKPNNDNKQCGANAK